MKLFATCARGLEPALAGELTALGAADIRPGRGGVHCVGDLTLLYRVNLYLRTAVRVLRPVLEADVRSPEDLYDAVRTVDWSLYMTPDHTLAVDCNVRDSRLTHSHYAALKTKDAICDQFVDRVGRRPSVDTESPMVPLNLHVHRDRAVLSLDSSGTTLHKRGYRPVQVKAPLNEALAAGLVLLTGWEPTTGFADPMCGSGTLPIEAAWLALGRPPGLTRRRFGFHGWPEFDAGAFAEVRDAARDAVRKELAAPVVGSDVRADAVRFADSNARAAGVGHLLGFAQRDLRDFRVPDGPPGVVLMNPPYGERIGDGDDLPKLYRLIGEVLRRQPYGWRGFVFTGNPDLAARIGLPVTSRRPLYNGRIACELLEFEMR